MSDSDEPKEVEYKCFNCNRKIPSNLSRKRIRCPYCGCKMVYKERERITKVKAR